MARSTFTNEQILAFLNRHGGSGAALRDATRRATKSTNPAQLVNTRTVEHNTALRVRASFTAEPGAYAQVLDPETGELKSLRSRPRTRQQAERKRSLKAARIARNVADTWTR